MFVRSGPPVWTGLLQQANGFACAGAADSGLMCEVTFSTACDVLFAGVSLFTDAAAVQQLADRDGHALQGLGYVVFPNLGIALADFDSDQKSDKAISVFSKGQWSDMEGLSPL